MSDNAEGYRELDFVFIESKTSRPAAGPRAVFRPSRISCCPVTLLRRDTEVLWLRKCGAKSKRRPTVM